MVEIFLANRMRWNIFLSCVTEERFVALFSLTTGIKVSKYHWFAAAPCFFVKEPYMIISAYWHRLEGYTPKRFLGEMLLIMFVLKILISIPLGIFVSWEKNPQGTSTQSVMMDGEVTLVARHTESSKQVNPPEQVFSAIIIAPLLETLFGQWLPIVVIGFFTQKLRLLIGGSALFFTLLHIPVVGILAAGVFPPALAFSFSWLIQRTHSRWRAYWMTAALHAAHNVIAVIIVGLSAC
jgi:hypothetical protein